VGKQRPAAAGWNSDGEHSVGIKAVQSQPINENAALYGNRKVSRAEDNCRVE